MTRARLQLASLVPAAWMSGLAPALAAPSTAQLESLLDAECAAHVVHPPVAHVFAALEAVAPQDVKVVVLGQDPYHGAGEAHGLAFSVQHGVAIPPSLRNIHKELAQDVGVAIPRHGNLDAWTRQGVLLLNTVLTVRGDAAGSHRKLGWEVLTQAVLDVVASQQQRVVFILWGKDAQARRTSVERAPHVVLAGVHPSPLSAHRGFAGSKPFSQANRALLDAGRTPVDWSLPG